MFLEKCFKIYDEIKEKDFDWKCMWLYYFYSEKWNTKTSKTMTKRFFLINTYNSSCNSEPCRLIISIVYTHTPTRTRNHDSHVGTLIDSSRFTMNFPLASHPYSPSCQRAAPPQPAPSLFWILLSMIWRNIRMWTCEN